MVRGPCARPPAKPSRRQQVKLDCFARMPPAHYSKGMRQGQPDATHKPRHASNRPPPPHRPVSQPDVAARAKRTRHHQRPRCASLLTDPSINPHPRLLAAFRRRRRASAPPSWSHARAATHSSCHALAPSIVTTTTPTAHRPSVIASATARHHTQTTSWLPTSPYPGGEGRGSHRAPGELRRRARVQSRRTPRRRYRSTAGPSPPIRHVVSQSFIPELKHELVRGSRRIV